MINKKFNKKDNKKYLSATPFPHIVIDDFIYAPILNKVIKEIPNKESYSINTHENKRYFFQNKNDFGKTTRDIIQYFSEPIVLELLENLTGVNNLIPDPYLHNGGLHATSRGGYLSMHIDNNKHFKLELYRRINLIIYLNKNWKDEYGGNLELWNFKDKNKVASIKPIFNRCTIFNVDKHCLHGAPEKVICPKEMKRLSLVFFYYTTIPTDLDKPHRTLWLERGNEEKSHFKESESY